VIVLDTNVLSELMKSAPDGMVTDWVTTQSAANLFITSITQAEILHGVLLLPPGRRRDAIEAAADAMFEEDFAGRILPFSSGAARAYAEIAVARRQSGRPISQFDAQIAAIAKSAGASVATRNVADFTGCGITVLDPWR
jgi:toxin FitB